MERMEQTKQGCGACMAQKSCLAGNQQLLLRSLPITTAVRITPTQLAAIVLLQNRRNHATYINPDRRKNKSSLSNRILQLATGLQYT